MDVLKAHFFEMTRSMLIDSELPNKYWGKGVMTASHLQNILPTVVSESTPYEKWNDRKPNLNYIRMFGCMLRYRLKIDKLDNKAKQLRLVGYEEGTKGYRLLDTMTDRIYISKDVIFIEGDPHTNQMTEDVNETESHHKLDNMPIKGSGDLEIDLQISEPAAIDELPANISTEIEQLE